MFMKLVAAGLLLAVGFATKLRYPEKDPCILIDVEANNSLSWNEEAIPNWSFNDSAVFNGDCNATSPFLEVIWAVDNGTMRFNFINASNTVNVEMVLSFEPDKAFKDFNNTDNSTVTILTTLKTSTIGKAYKCNAEEELTARSKDGHYTMVLRLSDVLMQGFGVENGSYSDYEECSQDKTTTPTTQSTPTTHSNVTTEPPTTGTTKPSTTPKPSTPPKVTLMAGNGSFTCALLVGKMTFVVTYNTSDGKSAKQNVFVPDSVKSSGVCGDTDNLTATFYDNWMMFISFGGDSDNFWWQELTLTVQFDNKTFPGLDPKLEGTNATYVKTFPDKNQFKASRQGSYLCNSDASLNLVSGIDLKTQEFQYAAFINNQTSFSKNDVSECEADAKTSSIVPIAVGAALAGLVVIVLVAYLIGRRRNRKGYESV